MIIIDFLIHRLILHRQVFAGEKSLVLPHACVQSNHQYNYLQVLNKRKCPLNHKTMCIFAMELKTGRNRHLSLHKLDHQQ